MSILEQQDNLPAFRQAIRDWLAEVVPPDWKARMVRASNEEFVAFQRWWFAERNKVGLGIPALAEGVRRCGPLSAAFSRHCR